MKTKRGMAFQAVILLLIIAGCPPPPPPLPPAPTPRDEPATTLTEQMKLARAAADVDYRQRLLAIAEQLEAGTIVYDTKLQLELSAAARDSGRPIKQIFADNLPTTGQLLDPKKTADVIRRIAEAY